MKIYKKLILTVFIILLVLLCKNHVYATETTQKLYQDITINRNGSITVKEVALLSGDYNGRLRDIEFKSYNSKKFTGIYSNFVGGTDIYDATAITDIKIADISQSNFKNFEDMHKIEKIYNQVNKASNGAYGVYTLVQNNYKAYFKIFCKSSKKKVFYMEYTIKDAVVVHNDVAELYWNVMGTGYEENIADFRVRIHLPGEDKDVRIWSHGPLTGVNSIIDKKTLELKDTNVKPYKAETIRIMFDKTLVPKATKKSGVKGKENILKYEASQADQANAAREKERLEKINIASNAVIELQESPSMYLYNNAMKYVTVLPTGSEEKVQLLNTLIQLKDTVNQEWKNSIERKMDFLEMDEPLSSLKYNLKKIEQMIEEGFDEQAKEEYRNRLQPFYKIVQQKEETTRNISLGLVIILYIIGICLALETLIRMILERKSFKEKYYREFPSEEEPYIIDYLMNERISNSSVSATILNLIAKKVIKVDEVIGEKGKRNVILVKEDINYTGTVAEQPILTMLFSTVGANNRCKLNELQEFGKTEYNARVLKGKIDSFKKQATKEAQAKEYFYQYKLKKTLKIVYLIAMLIASMLLQISTIFVGGADNNITNWILISFEVFIILFVIVSKEKNRTKNGRIEYSKWLAHKKFLKDFSRFDEKELPEIVLWEKYLVTATVLGCADKVQKAMELKMIHTDVNYLQDVTLVYYMSHGITHSIDTAVSKSISTATSTISIASSSDSSGGGFGGGSSSGGGRRRTAEAAEVVSKNSFKGGKNLKITDTKQLEEIAKKARKNIIEEVYGAKSGHPGSSLSCVDILTVLYFNEMNINPEKPEMEERDRLVLSKGHASPALYSILAQRGFFPEEELKEFRKLGSRLQGHPDRKKLPGVDMSGGSLGQGLSAACGMALASKLKKQNNRVYCVIGDGELQEGQIWEAAMTAAHYKLDNLCVIVDNNHLQIDGKIEEVMNPNPIDEKFESFGFEVLKTNGHDIKKLMETFEQAKHIKDSPTVIIAHTVKGKGVSFMENKAEWHGKAPSEEEYNQAIAELN